MSSLAAWSYTSKATHWPRASRDDWSDVATFGAPVVFDCDYTAEAKTLRDADGREFVSRLQLHTERAVIQRGDFVMIGASSAADPTQLADAMEVLDVGRYADTFEGRAEDLRVAT